MYFPLLDTFFLYSEHGRTIGSEDEDCEIEEKDKDTSELPLIIPSHSRKSKYNCNVSI